MRKPDLSIIFEGMKGLWIIIMICLLVGNGCNTKEPAFPIVPDIEFLSIDKTEVKEFEDFNITIRYRDGDGDLGNEVSTTDNYDLFLLDKRAGVPTPLYDGILRYNLPDLTTETRKPSIQGTITINVQGIVRINTLLAREKAKFGIYIKDRAGNVSDTVYTPEFFIIP